MATELFSPPRVSAPLTAPPPQLTRFVGRELELAEIARALETSRLVTLTGPGGAGKTRLALEVCLREQQRASKGFAWADLSTLSDPALLDRHVCAALGLGEKLEHSPRDVLIESLCPLGLLLVLDNCEHLVEACASLAHALLVGCGRLRILATSREALGIAGETAWIVPPLSLPASPDPPTAEGVAHSEAVQLFVGRAQAVQPAFVLTNANAPAVAQICRRLDGIPLAIELAAARMKVLPAEEIARRLDDAVGLLTTGARTAQQRHRTLRDAIDWSHELLTADERNLFRRVATFYASFTIDAAGAVCCDGSLRADALLDLISALVDKSLLRAEVHQGEARFSLLEPVRQYAREKLDGAGELEALRARHAEYFLSLAESAEPFIRGGTRGTAWMTRLERDRANLMAATLWCAEDATHVEMQLRLEAALLWFYFAQGYFREPRQRLTRALAYADGVSNLVLGRAQAALGYQAIWQGDYGAVGLPLRTAVTLLRGESDRAALSFALTGLAVAVGLGGDGPASHALFDEAHSSLGDRESMATEGFPSLLLYAFASYWRGVVAQFHGEAIRARESFELCVSVARQLDNHASVAHPLAALVRGLALDGELERAREYLAESLPIHAARDDRWGMAEALEGAAHLSAGEGELERAARLMGASDAMRDSIGLALPPHHEGDRTRLAERIRAGIGEHRFTGARIEGRRLNLARVMAEALGPAQQEATVVAAPLQAGDGGPLADPMELVDAGVGLRVLALGPLHIFREGEPLESSVWGSAKPRELLLFLLCHPNGATREQIGLALWPDASGERAGNSFHVTLHRLRKALGDPSWVTKVHDRYLVGPENRFVFDATVFEREVLSALSVLRAGDDGLRRLQTALGIYRGPFLEDEVVGDWHLAVRDRLRRINLDGLLFLGGLLQAEERYPEAAEIYWRVIADDDLHEEAYRQLMTSLARAGDRSQALRLYQRLCVLLERELGAQPEQETVALFERLQGAAAL